MAGDDASAAVPVGRGVLGAAGRRLGRAVRRHPAFIAVLAAGVALRVVTQIAYRPALLYIDSVKYLLARWQQFDPEAYRYLILLPVTAIGNLAVVAAFQHVLGLAMAVAGYLLLIRRGVPRWGATVAAAPVLLDGYQLQMEQTIMPDVMFEATIVAGVVVLLWRPRPGPRALAAAGLLFGLSATVRQVGEVLVVPAAVFAMLATRPWWRRLRDAGLLTAVFAVPVLGYMSFSAMVLHDHFQLSDQGDAVLYGRTAVAADCATLRIPRYERPLCPSPQTAATLGVDGLVNDPTSPVHRYVPPPGVNEMTAIKDFSYSVIEQQPLRIVGSIARDAVKLFAVTRHTDPGDTPISRWQFQLDYPTYPPAITDQTAAYLIRRAGGGGRPLVVRPLAAFLRGYQLHGGYTPGPYLLIAALAGVGGAVAYRRGQDSTPVLAALLATGVGIAVLLGADAYEFSWRYQLPALVTLPTAGALGAVVLVDRVRAVRRAWRPGATRGGQRPIGPVTAAHARPGHRSGKMPPGGSADRGSRPHGTTGRAPPALPAPGAGTASGMTDPLE